MKDEFEMLGSIINKKARGHILRTLRISNPKPLGTDILEACLADTGIFFSATQIEAEIKYLEEKGYVRSKKAELPIMGTTIRLVNLSPKGIDLLEKTIRDPGVAIK